MKKTTLTLRSVFLAITLIAQLIVGVQAAHAEVVLPKGSWLNCASGSDTYCIDSVSVIPTTGKMLALSWTTSGSNDAAANPAITSGKALPGRWTNASWATLGLGDPDKCTVIVEDGDGTSVGFALVAINGEVAEIELNGIDSDFQGKGAYTALLSWVMYTVANRGVKSLSISTQVQNNRVIRAWIKAGFNFDFALNTFHVMPRKK